MMIPIQLHIKNHNSLFINTKLIFRHQKGFSPNSNEKKEGDL